MFVSIACYFIAKQYHTKTYLGCLTFRKPNEIQFMVTNGTVQIQTKQLLLQGHLCLSTDQTLSRRQPGERMS